MNEKLSVASLYLRHEGKQRNNLSFVDTACWKWVIKVSQGSEAP